MEHRTASNWIKDRSSAYISNPLLQKFNETYAPYSYNFTVCDFFENQVRANGEKTAMLWQSGSMSYTELNEKSNQLGRLLRAKGVGPNVLVGIMVERSPLMIIGLFAILKAGGGYLPIDPLYPVERKNQIITDSKLPILLTHSAIDNSSLNPQPEVLNLDNNNLFAGNAQNLDKINSPEDIVYVIYTSGSTGTPKGVMIRHHSLVNRIEWMQKAYPIEPNDIILQKTTFTFDVSVWELFWWALQGGTVFLLPVGKEYDPRLITKLIEKYKISVMHFVPSVLRIFIEYLEIGVDIDKLQTLKWVFSSGEALSSSLVDRFNILFNTQKALLVNLYGPTEATIDVSHFPCHKTEKHKTIPIGKPISNISFFILDEELNLVELEQPGELYISGIGVAKGYLNNERLTKERFLENPYKTGEIMYKTGDLAQWTMDGNVLFLGRIDNQIKLRGLRIELGEIEYYLNQYKGISDSIVVLHEDVTGNQFLIAFIKLILNHTKPQPEDLHEHLSTHIPAYMIPCKYVCVEEFPFKSNGKVDRQELLKSCVVY